MTIDQLKPFCSSDKTRPALQSPFSQRDWTFATNGHICIRVPRLAKVSEVDGAPNCIKLFDLVDFDDTVRKWVKTPKPAIERTRCCWCEGTGFVRFDKLGDEVSCKSGTKGAKNCESCDGGIMRTGYNFITGHKGETRLAAIYIELIRALPDSKIGLLGNESDFKPRHEKDTYKPVCFRFDGGDGLLMPVRKD